MRKLIIILFFAFIVSNINALPVTKGEAIMLASNFLRFEAGVAKSNFAIKSTFEKIEKETTTFFIVNFDQGGFVIISADDNVEPILAYSTTNSIPENITNSSLSYWLNAYSRQIEFSIKNKDRNYKYNQKWSDLRNSNFKKATNDVGPLITTTWDQLNYYNALCPAGTYTGCVATAMAQIMKFWEYPLNGKSSNSYNQAVYGNLFADFTDNYDWNSIPDHGSITSSNNAVAELMFEAGVSVNMDYGTTGSGAQSTYVPVALANYFQYNQATIQQISKSEYPNNEDWFNLLKAEFDAGRPVYYSGSDDGGSGGHAWVCDGYDGNGFLHFNFGWSGNGNGFYAIGAINPNYQFNTENKAIIGIMPSEEEQGMMWVSKYSGFNANLTFTKYLSAVDDNVAWAIGGDGSSANANYKTFTKTTDGGQTWTSGAYANYGTSFSMICGIDAQTAYIPVWGSGAANNHLIKTTDGGATWSSVPQGSHSSSFFNVVHFFDANNGLLMSDPDSEFEIYTTSNEGASWTRVNGANIPNPLNGEYGISGMYTAVGNTIWFSTNKGRVYKSTDKGLNWSVFVIAPYGTDIELAFDDNAQNGICNLYNPNTQSFELFRTTNGGENWSLVNPTGNFYIKGISSVPGLPNTFVSVGSWTGNSTKSGVSFSTDGGITWNDFAKAYSAKSACNFRCVNMVSASKGYAGGWCNTINGTNDVAKDGMWVFGEADSSSFFATINVLETNICQGDGVNINASYFGRNNPTSYSWSFGPDAIPTTSNFQNPGSISFSAPGLKLINLEVTANGTTHTYSKYFLLTINTAPSAGGNIIGETNPTVSTTNVYFIDAVPEAQSYIWELPNFASGSSNSNYIDITFNQTGSGVISVKPVNDCGVGTASILNIGVAASVNENVSSINLSSYPNPNNGIINIENAIKSTLLIYDATGKLCLTQQISEKNNVIDIQKLTSGIYNLIFYGDNGFLYKTQIIKN